MRNFIILYGKWCGFSVFIMVLACGAYILLKGEWNQYGIAADGGKINFNQTFLWEEKPAIDARDCRVLQNQRVKFSDLGSARDSDGEDITDLLCFSDSAGAVHSDYLDTRTPGRYALTISVCSPRSGKTNKKDIIVLVDGRVGS